MPTTPRLANLAVHRHYKCVAGFGPSRLRHDIREAFDELPSLGPEIHLDPSVLQEKGSVTGGFPCFYLVGILAYPEIGRNNYPIGFPRQSAHPSFIRRIRGKSVL